MSQDNGLWGLATEITEAIGSNNAESMIKSLNARLIEIGWTPPPRVFLEGQDIPSHLPVINNHGEVRDDYQDWDEGDEEVYTANYDVVEMNIDYDAQVARAKALQATKATK